jgi:glucose-6-phosphate 1-dehydrogenase
MQDESKGWTRLIVEKPFGRDLESVEVLNKTLSQHFPEDMMFCIDHYRESVNQFDLLPTSMD